MLRYRLRVSSLSDQELAQAAAEAGVSPEELKTALAQRASEQIVAEKAEQAKAKTHGMVQAQFATKPNHALALVHQVFNQQVHLSPTQSKDGQISYVHEKVGIAYRLSSESDGTAMGALVRVEIDTSQWIRRVLRSILPMLALLVGPAFFIFEVSLSSCISVGVASLFSLYLQKRQMLKVAKKHVRTALERANQKALPER